MTIYVISGESFYEEAPDHPLLFSWVSASYPQLKKIAREMAEILRNDRHQIGKASWRVQEDVSGDEAP
jgi:hypothetical protein